MIICFGVLFALLAIILVWVDVRFSGVIYNSEQVRPKPTACTQLRNLPVSDTLHGFMSLYGHCLR